MKIKNKYIIGTHIMFYEIDMAEEHIQSINNALDLVENVENIQVDLFFNISEYFERIDQTKTSKEELITKFETLAQKVKGPCSYKIYDDNDNPVTMVDYRRDLNYFGCKEYDYIIWGESDCLIPKEIFQALEQIKHYANTNGIHRYVTTFATRKMWDASWEVLEHVDFKDKEYYETKNPDGTINLKAYNEPHSIRYTMNIDEMNAINSKFEEFDVRMINRPQFDGSCLVLSGDLIKNGVNVPHCIMGHLVDDTSMMYSCAQQMGDAYVQFIVKNILKVHNRQHPKKRLYAIDMDSDRDLALANTERKGDWFYKMKELVHFNLANFGKSQARFNTYKDFQDKL
tara:strand:+ start:770 stop:1795 length:1026 start_codon:yes stop_codon:yes gene_type:complete